MKPALFFLQKAESFLEELSAIELVPYQLENLSDDFYQDSPEDNHNDFFKQLGEIEHIKFQMNLMFSDFDKGHFFSAKLNDFTTENKYDNKAYLNHLIKINIVFMDFLKQYRLF